ncbi:MAG: hypothetical protein M3Q42_02165 [Pseudomonadota bacterium]|nr:hypothetical protein [Pseudomonadota bacterium]
MSAQLPSLVQESGVPLDLFIQALTEQLDKAQASMAIKARVGKLPLTFAVKDLSIDLRAFVQVIDDDIYVRAAGPGESDASTIKLALTTITRSMVEENAVDFAAEEPQFSLREALGDRISESEQRQLERIGVRTVSQLNELKRTAGTDVIARLSRMPVNRLQQALLQAAVPRVTRVEPPTANGGARVHVSAPRLRAGRVPLVRAAGAAVPVITASDGQLVLAPMAMQLGSDADVDFGDGECARVQLSEGRVGEWSAP